MKRGRMEQRVDERLSAYIDGELSQAERSRLEADLASDPALQQRLEGLRQTVALVRDLPQVQAPRNFLLTPAMVTGGSSESRRTWSTGLFARRWMAPAMTFASAISALIFVVALWATVAVGSVNQMAGLSAPDMVSVEGAEGLLPQAERAGEPVTEADEAVEEEVPAGAPMAMLATDSVSATMTLPAPAGGGADSTAEAWSTPDLDDAQAAPTDTPSFGGEEVVPQSTPSPMQVQEPSPQTMPWIAVWVLGGTTLVMGALSAVAWRKRRY